MAAVCIGCRRYVTFVRWPPFAEARKVTVHERSQGCRVTGGLTVPANRSQEAPAGLARGLGPMQSESCWLRVLHLPELAARAQEAKGKGEAGPCPAARTMEARSLVGWAWTEQVTVVTPADSPR